LIKRKKKSKNKRVHDTSHFQEEWVARGLLLDHNKEDQMVPIMDTCLGYTAVLGAELFNEQEQMEVEVS